MKIFTTYQQFNEASADAAPVPNISGLQPDEVPMITGIAEILRQVKDVENRREIADDQIRQFKAQGISFDYGEFIKMCQL
jgi:hypothetical protein